MTWYDIYLLGSSYPDSYAVYFHDTVREMRLPRVYYFFEFK